MRNIKRRVASGLRSEQLGVRDPLRQRRRERGSCGLDQWTNEIPKIDPASYVAVEITRGSEGSLRLCVHRRIDPLVRTAPETIATRRAGPASATPTTEATAVALVA